MYIFRSFSVLSLAHTHSIIYKLGTYYDVYTHYNNVTYIIIIIRRAKTHSATPSVVYIILCYYRECSLYALCAYITV